MDTDIKINITDLQLRNLAEHIPPKKFHELGLGLGLTVTDLSAINQETADPVTKTFRILDRWRSNLDPFLIRWRNKVDGKETERLKLETALRQSGLDMFIPCIGKGAKTCLYIISNSTRSLFFFHTGLKYIQAKVMVINYNRMFIARIATYKFKAT